MALMNLSCRLTQKSMRDFLILFIHYARIRKLIFIWIDYMLLPFFRWFLLLTVTLSGCTSIGPQQMNIDRGRYNDIVRETDQEQLLKNIVRLRYLETTSYLQVSGVTASYSRSSSISGTNLASSASNNAPATNWTWASVGFTPSTTYSDSPTISYVPITNSEFIESLQTPVPFVNIIMLSRDPIYQPHLLLTLLLDKIGPLDNSDVSKDKQYCHFIQLFQKMFDHKTMEIEPMMFNHQPGLMLYLKNSHSADAMELKKILGISSNAEYIGLIGKKKYLVTQNKSGSLIPQNTEPKMNNVVYVQSRSIDAIMSFLSHGVKIPEEDLKAHVTMEIIHPNGTIYDWSPIMRNIMTIYSSEEKPENNAFIKTFVNGHWFYIKASDLDSKMSFNLLVRLIALTSVVSNTQAAPALTLPIN